MYNAIVCRNDIILPPFCSVYMSFSVYEPAVLRRMTKSFDKHCIWLQQVLQMCMRK